jgi:hypothetical protein
MIGCKEIVDTSMLVVFDAHDVQLALVANTEYQFSVGETIEQTSWIINEEGLEDQVTDK